MYLSYGAYQFDNNATTIESNAKLNRNKAKIPYSVTRTMHVRGYLSGASQDACVQAENALRTALIVPYQDIVFHSDDGTQTVALTNSGSITGVVITDGPHFNNSAGGAEYATVRSFEFTAEAEYTVGRTTLLDFSETIHMSGGYPMYAYKLAINGAPQKQLIYPQTTYKCTQTGKAAGYSAYPPVNPPKFPASLLIAPKITQVSPERMGVSGYQNYITEWSYEFEDTGPLIATPTLWIGN